MGNSKPVNRNIRIENLRDMPQYLETLARWHQKQWGDFNKGEILKQRIARMQPYLDDNFIPSTWVAADEVLLGSAAIVKCDMDTRPDLTPWMASVYVAPQFRKQGIASQLVSHVMENARQNGIKKIYLFTPDQVHLYSTLGWQEIEQTEYHGQQVTIMEAKLSL